MRADAALRGHFGSPLAGQRDTGAVGELVFVYGTLRRGGVRALPTLFPTSQDLGPATVKGVLVDFGAFPGLQLVQPGSAPMDSRVVHGELYAVDQPTLDRLDEIEVYLPNQLDRSYYFRVPADVARGSHGGYSGYSGYGGHGEIVQAWTYEYNPALLESTEIVSSGDWIAYVATKANLPLERWPDGRVIER